MRLACQSRGPVERSLNYPAEVAASLEFRGILRTARGRWRGRQSFDGGAAVYRRDTGPDNLVRIGARHSGENECESETMRGPEAPHVGAPDGYSQVSRVAESSG
jgi:hypothetical protein